ncbi:hypothetical protein EC957_002985 [Mortierella hygrophila]|uniref:SAP domain-containing protein n=1 Tax=Mortierella hygrophila TaxID=979708 RepID=A0A9P6F4I1_9FUNG|nr:hypothetical protein EC957_002985 [Mortierella hygrophila]
MSSALSKRRKHELKELASSLGISSGGVREELVERIRQHVVKHGTSDPSLRDLLREESPRASSRRSTESSRLASLSSAADGDDDDSSDGGVRTRSRRSSPKKSTMHVTATHNSKFGRGSDSDSAEDPLSEHLVRNFMGDLQTDIHDAKELAISLEHTLHEKLQSGQATIRRASKDLTSNVVNAIEDVVGAVSGNKGKSENSDHHRHSRYCLHGQDGEEEDMSLCYKVCSMIKHRFANCASCTSNKWQALHDLGSNSLGFVWITLLLELTVFLTSAFAQNSQNGEGWFSCLNLLINWPNFLKPFFAYYGALFVIPTLLSQLFNVDRSRLHKHDQTQPSGLLSRKTTSGLSYFVFKFAITYFLSQTLAANLRAANPGLVGLAKEAVETVVNHVNRQPALMKDCDLLTQIFRYIPESVSLSTSGVGTILALAETALSRRR